MTKKAKRAERPRTDEPDLLKAKSPWSADEGQNARAMAVTLDSLGQAVAAMGPKERADFERGARDYGHVGNLIDEMSGHVLAAAFFAPEAGLRELLSKVLPTLFEIRVRVERMSRGLPPVPLSPPEEHLRGHRSWCQWNFFDGPNAGKCTCDSPEIVDGKFVPAEPPKKPWNQDAEVR